jgi:hypothetical protein
MLSVVLFIAFTLYASAIHWICKKKFMGRIQVLERDLQGFSDVISKIAEAQTNTIQKFSSRFEDLEERFMDLSVPSQDSNLPLERRHQVLALARQGMPLEEISKRLKAPVGEAELILNLRRYLDKDSSPSAKRNKKVSSYV